MSPVDKRLVRRAFSRAAVSYDEVAVLQREMAERMLERLSLFKLQPSTILDLGAGTGQACPGLLKRYPRARLIALDFALPMLQQAARRRHWLRRPSCLCADMDQLPLANASCDLIFSNATLQWSTDLDQTLAELRRVLRPGGLLLVTSFGPDTLHELRRAWAQVDGHQHVNPFPDIHDLGDALLRNGLAQPVLDLDRITLTYANLRELMTDLKRLGAHNVTSGRNHALTGKQRLRALEQAYEAFRHEGLLPASYEIVHAHAWAAESASPRTHGKAATDALGRPTAVPIQFDALKTRDPG